VKALNLSVEKILNLLAENCLSDAKNMHRSDIVDDIQELWRALTVERDIGVQKYFQKASNRRAYLGYYFPMYVAKVALLLERLDREGHFDQLKTQPIKLLDLGSGTLTGVAALKIFFKDQPFKALALDKSLAPMRLGFETMKHTLRLDVSSDIRFDQANILAPKAKFMPRWSPNFIFLGHVVNELGQGPRGKDRKVEFLEDMLLSLDPDGMMLIVEPATQVATRNLMMLRDHFANREDVQILAPCTGAEACPLLKTPTSWCFSELKWKRPASFAQIDSIIGFDREALKSSFLLLSRTSHAPKKARLRVVGGTMKSGGDLRRYLCTSEGLKTLVTGVNSEAFPAANGIKRGEILPTYLTQRDDVKIVREK
jgi:ribosomal protein RSM22 (predicted rRNA methylase)